MDDGVVMVVTDLHGDWPLYQRYRDIFLALRERELVDTLVIAGDLIHSEGPSETDRSLDIVLDLMALHETLGPRLVVLLGNHEMAHLYAVVLSKGDVTYTPRFEAALGSHRDAVLSFFDSLVGARWSVESDKITCTFKQFLSFETQPLQLGKSFYPGISRDLSLSLQARAMF